MTSSIFFQLYARRDQKKITKRACPEKMSAWDYLNGDNFLCRESERNSWALLDLHMSSHEATYKEGKRRSKQTMGSSDCKIFFSSLSYPVLSTNLL